MTARTVCMMAVFALALLANATIASWLSVEIHYWKALQSLTFESVSSNESHTCVVKFGYGHVELELVSLGPNGKTEFHSAHLRY